jgi:hypothetical protein
MRSYTQWVVVCWSQTYCYNWTIIEEKVDIGTAPAIRYFFFFFRVVVVVGVFFFKTKKKPSRLGCLVRAPLAFIRERSCQRTGMRSEITRNFFSFLLLLLLLRLFSRLELFRNSVKPQCVSLLHLFSSELVKILKHKSSWGGVGRVIVLEAKWLSTASNGYFYFDSYSRGGKLELGAIGSLVSFESNVNSSNRRLVGALFNPKTGWTRHRSAKLCATVGCREKL